MRIAVPLLVLVLIAGAACAQEQEKKAPEPKKPAFVSPSARLAAAKTAFVQNAGGNEIPFNVVSMGLEGWGRYQLVDSPAKADIVIEVLSPEEETTSTSKKTRVAAGGRMEDSITTSRNFSEDIKLVVYDAKTHIALWSASERPKGALREKAQEDHMVEAAQRLVTRFRERLEPPAPAK